MSKSTLLRATALITSFEVMVASMPAIAQRTLVEGGNLEAKEILATEHVYGFRRLPQDAIKQVTPGSNLWVLSTSAILGSAQSIQWLTPEQRREAESALNSSNQSGVTTERVLQSVLRAYDKGQMKPQPSADIETTGSWKPPKVASYAEPGKGTQSIDVGAVGQILAYGRPMETSYTFSDAYAGTHIGGVLLASDFAISMKDLYSQVGFGVHSGQTGDISGALTKATEAAFYDPRVAATSLSDIGPVDFGRPLAYTAKDMSLDVKPSITQLYDVYWVEFAVSPSKAVVDRSSALTFTVTLGSSAEGDPANLALQLSPRQLVHESTRAAADGSTADGSVTVREQAGNATVETYYGHTVEYRYLRPTIESVGLQAPKFGWIMKDDMVTPAAKRFVAIVGVPKGARDIKCSLVLSVDFKGAAFWQVDQGTTKPIPCDITLPR